MRPRRSSRGDHRGSARALRSRRGGRRSSTAGPHRRDAVGGLPAAAGPRSGARRADRRGGLRLPQAHRRHQCWTFTDLPRAARVLDRTALVAAAPARASRGSLVGLTVRYLPGRRRGVACVRVPRRRARRSPRRCRASCWPRSPASASAPSSGPEAPLIALGGGLAVLAVRLGRRDAPGAGRRGRRGDRQLRGDQHAARLAARRGVPAARGAQHRRHDGDRRAAARAARRRRRRARLHRPGLASPGSGPSRSPSRTCHRSGTPTVAEFGWAIVIGLVAGSALRRVPAAGHRACGTGWCCAARCWPPSLLGLVIAGLAIGYAAATGHGVSDVLFSGQSTLPGLLTHSARLHRGRPAAAPALQGSGVHGRR